MDNKILKKIFKVIIIFFILIIILFYSLFLLWTSKPLKALKEVNNYLISNEEVNVEVKKNKDIFFLTKSKSEKNLIFYPGGNVDYLAYSPLCFKLAKKGINVILLKMPFNLAIFGINRADKYIKNSKEINRKISITWFLCGHSLGGVAATIYGKNNYDKIKGIILLASYPSSDVSNLRLNILLIYASNDGLATKEKIENKKSLLPQNTKYFSIDGGNHSGFGYYEFQKGDLEASITKEEQIEITANKIVEFINSF